MNINLSVNVPDKVIVVDGEGYTLSHDFPSVGENLRGLQWIPGRQGRCKGTAQHHVGGAEGFNDWERVAPFYAAWQARKAFEALMEQAYAENAPQPVPAQSNDEPQTPSVATDMQARFAEFSERIQKVVDQVSETFQAASKTDNERIAAMEASHAKLEAVVAEILAEFRSLRRGE